MVYVAVALAWLGVGAVVGVVEARRGGWHRGWVVSAIFGPLAIPLALERRHAARPSPRVLTDAGAMAGPVDLLVGFDGSASSLTAAAFAARLLGPRVRRLTLATVLDVDTAAPHADSALYPDPWPEERTARERLEAAVSVLHASLVERPGSVILAGEPAGALERYAIDEGYEVIVVGCRGRGASKLLLGSCASSLAGKTHVPVLLIPGDAAGSIPAGQPEAAPFIRPAS